MENQAPETGTPQAANKDERTWAMLCHIGAFAGFLFPFGNVIAPLVIWLIKKEEYPLVDDQGKESLNFQIAISIAALVCVILAFLLIGFILLPVLAIINIVMPIIAAMKANEGQKYRYPFSLRLIK
ncbi:MAG: orotate phosphoribosyltransferase [Lentisphaerae bacterium GWF2_52_8]|nr:MAG: orotate phosphoribosyltransferase [Lentisphaerae bacterium GWF2_52_8]